MIYDFIDLMLDTSMVDPNIKFVFGFVILYTIFIGIIEIFKIPFRFF